MSDQFKRLTKVLAKSFSLNDESLQSCFRIAEVEEISKISALRRHVFEDEIKDNDELYLSWRYFGREQNTSTLWVFEFDNRIIASMGTEPVDLWYNGKIIKALRNMDAIVDPGYNSRGLGAWMTLAMQNTNDCVLVTGGNKNSSSMLNKLFTALNVRKNYKIILHSQYFLRNKINNAVIIKILTPFLDTLLALYLNIKLSFITQPESWKIEYYDDIQSLLPYVKEQTGVLGKVRVLRSDSYLNWRYSMNPCSKFNVLAMFDGQNCLGYVIYIIFGSVGSSMALEAYIMDWDVFNESSKSQILSSLFKATVREIQARGMDEINVELNDKDSERSAMDTGFIFRYEDPNFFVFHKNLSSDDDLFSAGAWYHSLGDSDNI